MATIETIQLIFSDLGKNSYKVWKGELHDDGRVVSHFGAVGAAMQSCDYGCVGKSFLDKKVREKQKKGYALTTTVAAGQVASNEVSRGSLADIALSQIKHSNDAVKALIKRLADSNVHKITSSTNIVFDKDSGLFATPLGIVNFEAITEARDILTFLNDSPKVNAKYKKNIDAYLRLIPRRKGQSLSYESIFPTLDEVKKESDVLDALENSLSLLNKPQKGSSAPTVAEKVFALRLDALTNNTERDRVIAWYQKTNKPMHHYTHLQVQNIYEVDIEDYNKNFDSAIGSITEVWHGSSQANILSILKSGLKVSPPSTAAIAGKMFGNGVYGSQTASKSIGYSLGRWRQPAGESGWLFVCEFAMGKANYPTGATSHLPTGYDSFWAQPEKTGLLNDELIVFKEAQIRVKYLLEIK